MALLVSTGGVEVVEEVVEVEDEECAVSPVSTPPVSRDKSPLPSPAPAPRLQPTCTGSISWWPHQHQHYQHRGQEDDGDPALHGAALTIYRYYVHKLYGVLILL